MREVIESCAYPTHPPPVSVRLHVLPEHACPYLPDRTAQLRGFLCERMGGEVYHAFMDRAFRRSGRFFYQPVCCGCRECIPIRVPTGTFTPSKSQRRVWRRNPDVVVTAAADARPTKEKYDLYVRYQRDRHDPDRVEDYAGFADFLYRSTVDSLEFAYRNAAGKLIGVGVADVCEKSLSSVYFYFDPAESRRGLGIFSAMWEIDFALRQNIPHYYLGYWVRGCASMSYKADFRPCELLDPDGVWRAERLVAGEQRDENCAARAVEMPK